MQHADLNVIRRPVRIRRAASEPEPEVEPEPGDRPEDAHDEDTGISRRRDRHPERGA